LKGVDSQSTKEEEKVFENEKKEKSKNGQIWKKDKVSDVKGGDRFIKLSSSSLTAWQNKLW
jgi:hypothetical protein